jgi:putative FmdB family regulatory protein
MPTYTYECGACGHRFDEFHSIKDEKPRRCPVCKKRAHRVPSGGAGLLFKGSGFYITDYRSSAYRDKAKQEKPKAGESGGGSGGGGASGTSEAKPAKSGGTKPSGGS